jgi:hypothetical protein
METPPLAMRTRSGRIAALPGQRSERHVVRRRAATDLKRFHDTNNKSAKWM